MNKKLLFFLFGLFIMVPINLFAQNTPPGNPGGRPHLIPGQQLLHVSYDEEYNEVVILFRQNVTQATLFIYKDGILVDEDYLTNIQAGDSFTTNLPLFGTGLFTIYIQIGERMYAVFEEEIVE